MDEITIVEVQTQKVVGMRKRGKYELDKHGNSITDKAKYRWRGEPNKRLLIEANRFYDVMSQCGYNEFWGY